MRPLAVVLPELASSELFGFTIGKGDVVPPGDYALAEIYCDEKRCDCRRVVLYVLSKRGKKPSATISFGFDPDGPDPGPYLDPFAGPNGKHAEGFLKIFVEMVNTEPALVEGLQRHYVKFREVVTRKKYRGRPFPKAGAVKRVARASYSDDGLDELRLMVLQADVALQERGSAKAGRLLAALAAAVADRLEDYARLLASEYGTPEAPGRAAAFVLLERALSELKAGLERGREESRKKADAFQAAVALGVVQQGPTPLLADVLHALQESKWEPSDALRSACLEVNDATREFLVRRGPPDLTPILEEAQQAGPDGVFDFYDVFLAQLRLLDSENQVRAVAALAENPQPLAREVATLMLLHPDRAVRVPVAALLADRSPGRGPSPEAFRRLVTIRNWVPEDERPALDALIREARLGRVECAPMTRRSDTKCVASTVDGSGAQALWFEGGDEDGVVLGAVVVRQGYGVRDAFCHRELSKSEVAGLRRDMERSVLSRPVGQDYVEKAVSHALHEGAVHGSLPTPRLLQLAETFEGLSWKASALDVDNELARLEAEAGSPDPGRVARVFAESAAWPKRETFAETWFESDATVDEALEGIDKRAKAEAREAVIIRVLEPRRQAWVERLLWMALWAREGKPLRRAPWQSFFVLAQALARGRPLAEIPLMAAVADLTVGVARAAG